MKASEVAADQLDAKSASEIAIEGAGDITLSRLHALVNRGYKAELGGNSSTAVWLYHPSKKFGCPALILYSRGLVVSAPGLSTHEIRIERTQAREFQDFLKEVPSPSFWDRTREFRTSIVAWAILGFVAVCGGWVGHILTSRLD